MCTLCDAGKPQNHSASQLGRRDFLRKWKGRLLNVNLGKLRRELENSRDFLFEAAGIPQDLFRAP